MIPTNEEPLYKADPKAIDKARKWYLILLAVFSLVPITLAFISRQPHPLILIPPIWAVMLLCGFRTVIGITIRSDGVHIFTTLGESDFAWPDMMIMKHLGGRIDIYTQGCLWPYVILPYPGNKTVRKLLLDISQKKC